jgi:chromosome segregation ATPase
MDQLFDLLPVVASAIIAVVGYLARAYLEQQKKSIQELKDELKRAEGRFDALIHEIRANTVELIKVRTELQAVWRFIDHQKESTHGRGVR